MSTASGISIKTVIIVAIIAYLFFSYGKKKNDAPSCSDNENDVDETFMLSLADYSLTMPEDQYETAEVPFQRPIRPCQVFSQSYEEARSTFLDASNALNDVYTRKQNNENSKISTHSLAVFTDEETKQKYTTDIVVIPGNAPGLVIHSSGVHGVEGYAGSAIQIAFLHLVRQFYESGQLLLHPTIVLVHAINPVGMARYRRVNEHNVDLNRNGLLDSDWTSDYVTDNPNRDNYNKFSASFFNPPTAPNWWNAGIGYFIKAAGAIARYGIPRLKAAMVGAQYHDPKGIFYGGSDHAEPSLRLVKEWLQDFLSEQESGNDDDTAGTEAVTWIDVHTGLGPFGEDTLLTTNTTDKSGNTDNDGSPSHVQQYFTGHIPGINNEGSAVSQGYEEVKGFINNYYRPLLTSSLYRRPLILSQEFGTFHNVLVARALIVENAAFQHLPPDEALEWAKKTTKLAFYPQSREWRRRILKRGIRLLVQAMNRSKNLSNQT